MSVLGIASAIIGGIAVTNQMLQGIGNWVSNKNANEANYEQTEKWNQVSQENWQKQFDYNRYVTENQYSIGAKDAASAGLNPLAMSGNSAAAGFSTNAASFQSANQRPNQLDLGASSMLNLAGSIYGSQTQRIVANDQIQAEKSIAKDKLAVDKYDAETRRILALEQARQSRSIANRTEYENEYMQGLDPFNLSTTTGRLSNETKVGARAAVEAKQVIDDAAREYANSPEQRAKPALTYTEQHKAKGMQEMYATNKRAFRQALKDAKVIKNWMPKGAEDIVINELIHTGKIDDQKFRQVNWAFRKIIGD